MKRISLLLVAALLMMPAAIAFASGQKDAAEAGMSEGPTNLRLLWWGGQTRHERTLEVLDMYQQANSDVTIEAEYIGWSGYWDRLSVLAAADDMPDVFQMVIERLGQYDERNLLADLYEVESFNVDQVDQGALSTGEVDGRLLGAVLGTNAYTLAYNPRILEEAGVDAPSMDWSWADLEEAAQTIRAETGHYGLDAFGTDNDFLYWVRQNGEQFYARSLDSPGWSGDRMVTRFYQQMVDFMEQNVTPPAEYQIEHYSNEENTMFAEGEAAMKLLWSNKVVSVRNTLGADLELSLLPGPNVEQGMYLRPSMYFSVAEPSAKKEAAAEFINYFLGNVAANQVLNADRGVPVVPEVRNALAESADSQTQTIFDFISLVGEHSSPLNTHFPQNEGELIDEFNRITQQVMFGELSPSQGAENLSERWTQLMNQ